MSIAAIRTAIASAWTWFVLAAGLVVAFPFIVLWRFLAWPFDRMNYAGGRLFRLVGVAMVKLTPRWHFSVRGEIPANPRNPYVVVANHESFADLPLLCFLPWEMKWLSKVEIMWIPVLGWEMWAAHDVGIKRGFATSARQAMAECRKRLEGKVSVMMFPEGTRSPTREMLPFRDGAFRLAIDSGVPILPVVIHGTRDAIARHDWQINRATAVAQVLTPEPSTGVSVDELKARVRARIERARAELRQEFEGRAAAQRTA